MTLKIALVLLTWGLALLVSWLLRLWGVQHPDPFQIRLPLIFLLLVGPSVVLGLWIAFVGFRDVFHTDNALKANNQLKVKNK